MQRRVLHTLTHTYTLAYRVDLRFPCVYGRFWMCTGDKFSTALTISQTCNLKPKENALVTIDGKDAIEVLSL